ncbi:Odr-4-like protein [Elysia marginata]|uniref:Odr-4-like protein n=1 Tax=Elysia marginata TaxID=1093978 RepID=A0AAV4G1I4_9GAST|nr:Odr-4-like protein [Elysia marginata]
MGRSLIAEEHVEKYIEKLLKENKWYTGVIIGQLTAQKDYVVHMARTPDPVEDEVSEENVDEDTGDAAALTKKSKAVRPASLEELDEKWVSTHAKQVTRMLPGGLNVVGLFVIAPPAMLKSSQAKLRQMLFSVHKTLSRNTGIISAGEITDRILVQIDMATKRMTCSTVNVADVKSALTPAEWKVQTGGGQRWVGLTSQVSIDIPVAVPSSSKSVTLLKQIQSGLSDFARNVSKSIVTIDGVLRQESEPLITSVEKKAKGGKGKGGGSSDSTVVSKSVNFYLPFTSAESHSAPEISESQASISMAGAVVVRAYVTARATVGDAIQAMRADLLRSLLARCELLCEEFDVVEPGKQGSEVYDPPVRLFCRLHATEGGGGAKKGAAANAGEGVEVCDYVFQDEKKEEVRQRIQELLDVEEVLTLEEAEKSPAEDDNWSCQSSLSAMSSHQSLASPNETNDSTVKTYIGAAVGGIVALAATWLSYMYISDE